MVFKRYTVVLLRVCQASAQAAFFGAMVLGLIEGVMLVVNRTFSDQRKPHMTQVPEDRF